MNEEKYLDETTKLIDELITKNTNKVNATIETLSEIKHYVWDNISDLDPSEIQFMKNELEKEIDFGNMSAIKKYMLLKMKNDPYFGRIDFKSNKEEDKVYIGLSSVMDDKFNIYVYDWRSPIASMYYDFELGNAYYIAPEGKINGELTLKRQYKIENGKLEFCLDSNVSINDDLLLETLSNNNTDYMKNIVTTIQKEQNKIIRDASSKSIIVEGPAGCGKTSVALHHIAYLLYKNKDYLTSNNILIFSPNKIFSEYISHVLPELGEKNAIHTEFSSFINSFLNEYNRVESYSNFLKRIYQNKKINKLIEIKLDDNFYKVIDFYVNKITNNIHFNDIYVGSKYLISKREVRDIFMNDLKKYPLLISLRRLKDYLVSKYNRESIRKVNQLALERIIRNNLPNYHNIKKLLIDMYKDVDVRNLIKEMYHVNDNFFDISIAYLKKDTIKYEDAIILSYLKGSINGYYYSNNIKQVVIDEGQDYTNMQYLILRNIFKDASFTILGDSNQAVNPLVDYKSLDSLGLIFKDALIYKLKNTYRSTYEITKYTSDMIGLECSSAVNRHGDEVITYSSLDEIDFNSNYNSTAIIVYDEDMVDTVYNYCMNRGIKVNRYLDKDIDKKIIIIPVYYAKGLEYERVIVVSEKMNKKINYVACTRALHRLEVVCK